MDTVKRLRYWTFAFVATSFICFVHTTSKESKNVNCKPGRCPAYQAGRVCPEPYDIHDECFSDFDCFGNQKCCSDGCELKCLSPAVEKTAPEPNNIAQYCRPGECPSIPIGENCPNFWELQDDCYLDYQCPAGQKCCSDGCELRCMSTKSDKKIKFPEKNKTQVIEANNIFPLDLKAFYIGDSSFFGFTGWGRGYLHIFKWYNSSVGFKKYQMFKNLRGSCWEPFTIGGDQYFVAAERYSSDGLCYVYKWNTRKKKFVKSSKSFQCKYSGDIESFKVAGKHHIAVGQDGKGLPFMIFRWNGTTFKLIQKIDYRASFIKAFELSGIIYIGVTDGSDKTVALYKWDGSLFTIAQRIKTNHYTYEIDALTVRDQSFIAVAANEKVLLFKWNGKEFKEFQQIRSRRASRISAISSPMMHLGNTYLAVNSQDSQDDVPVIYLWNSENKKFVKDQIIMLKDPGNIKFIEISGHLYLVVSTYKRVHVYKGVMVQEPVL